MNKNNKYINKFYEESYYKWSFLTKNILLKTSNKKRTYAQDLFRNVFNVKNALQKF